GGAGRDRRDRSPSFRRRGINVVRASRDFQRHAAQRFGTLSDSANRGQNGLSPAILIAGVGPYRNLPNCRCSALIQPMVPLVERMTTVSVSITSLPNRTPAAVCLWGRLLAATSLSLWFMPSS